MAGSKDRLGHLLITRHLLAEERNASAAGRRWNAVGERAINLLSQIGKDANLDRILAEEILIVTFSRDKETNSLAMQRSLDMAVSELKILRSMVERVRDPETYRKIDLDHERPKDSAGQLPNDSGRQIFKSHLARLLNQDKAPLDLIDKKIIDARRANMRVAEKAYIALQQVALGITPEPPNKGPERGMEL